MDNIVIEKTEYTPEVLFKTDGKLLMTGRAFSEDPSLFFNKLITWCSKLKAEKVILDMKIDYLNTASTKSLYHVIRAIEENLNIHEAEILWHYEFDDEEMLETGEILSELCEKVRFKYFILQF